MNDNQNKELIQQQEKERVKVLIYLYQNGEINIRYYNAKEDVNNKHKIQDDYQKDLTSLIKNNDKCNDEDRNYKRSMYERQRKIEKLNWKKSLQKNLFSEKKNTISI